MISPIPSQKWLKDRKKDNSDLTKRMEYMKVMIECHIFSTYRYWIQVAGTTAPITGDDERGGFTATFHHNKAGELGKVMVQA